VIVFGVSSTVAIVLIALGVLSFLHDGASAVRRRAERKSRAASLYGNSSETPPNRR